uniref:NADH-ubiquinone oxidoreductase chain 4L n=1 Tax=Prionospio multibranchiata TaxID=3050093 RepID=A0AAU6QGA8_9ANNE
MISTLLPLLAITFFSLMSFVCQRQHILMCLLSLEAALLSLAFTSTIVFATLNSLDMFYCIIILTFGACEAAVALAVLVTVTRTCGSDLIKAVNMNKC